MASTIYSQRKAPLNSSQNDVIVWSREAAPIRRFTQEEPDDQVDNDDADSGVHRQNLDEEYCYYDIDADHDEEETANEENSLRYRGEILDDDDDDDSMEHSNNFNVHENFYRDPYPADSHYFRDMKYNVYNVPPPPSLFEEYDADDEKHLEQEEPIRQISILDNNQELCHDDTSLEYSVNDSQDPVHMHSQSIHVEKYEENSSQDVIRRIESVMMNLTINHLDKLEGPVLHEYKNPYSEEESIDNTSLHLIEEMLKYNASAPFKQFDNIARQRVFTSVVLVMSFIHLLLLSNRTTTTREVYYVFVTHFRSQNECDSAILDVARCLGVPRRALGLSASPKGWFCGSIEITRRGTLPSGKDVSGSIDGTALSSIQGLPITREWFDRDENGLTEEGVEIKVSSKTAKVILVIEKEGVYNRLAEERIFDQYPCILITGKGFPDLATRALVKSLHRELDIPVVGLCDCNPYGVSVLALYHFAGDRMGVDGNLKYSVPIRWIGLRPSTVSGLKDRLPKEVFQKLTDRDYKRIDALLDETHSFLNEEREEEILSMKEAGYKVELEALYWIGADYMGDWVVNQLESVDDESEWEKVAI